MSLRPAGEPEVLRRLWQLYRHDLSASRGTLPGPDGRFDEARLDAHLDRAGRRALLVVHDELPAGLVLLTTPDRGPWVLGEFFVVRALRGTGLAERTALEVLGLHAGAWELAFQEANPTAARFWRRVAARAAPGQVREELRAVPGKPDAPPDTWLVLRGQLS